MSNWLASAAGTGRSASLPIKKSSDRTFVLLEIWANANARQAFESLGLTQALLGRIQALLEAPLDVRPGTLIVGE